MSKCCIIKSNTPELRQRLEQSGISVCICSSFKEADWLDDLSKEAYQEDFIKEINPIICESEDEFINMCKQFKRK